MICINQRRAGELKRAAQGNTQRGVGREPREECPSRFPQAGVQPIWLGPPTALEIRALDAERFLADPALAEPASEDDLDMARCILAERSAEDIAAALVRLYRGRLPAMEDVTDPGERRRGPRAPGWPERSSACPGWLALSGLKICCRCQPRRARS